MNENYKQIKEQKIEELNAVGKLFLHEKSGARVLFMLNDDENKTFSITFRTPPNDSTGLPHILEHSVLCGSRKFPVKDPFVELAKGSLNTFLNAMTFSDKTMYPVSSCNDKDFENLMDVYMDAALYPNIHKEPRILKQEGWHYDLVDSNANITYKGVVYNEMKGAFSSPEQVLFRRIQQSLFPDTAYQYESGGDPDYITDLTYEDFTDYHKKYYHPSNSYIFIYGNFNEEEKLKWLHENYLKDFDKINIDSEITEQESFEEQKVMDEYYPISSNEATEGKTYLSLNYVTGSALDPQEYIALEILEYVLLEAPGAPLKKALLEAGIGRDVFGSFDNSILQPTFSIIVKNSEEGKKEEFKKIVNDTLSNIVENGLNKRNILAGINYFEFKIKEADYGRYPKGIIYAMKTLNSWLYDGSPFTHLVYNPTFEKLKAGIEESYFTGLIDKYFLKNNHSTLLALIPDSTLLAKKEREVINKLQAYKETLSAKELEKLVSDTKALEMYQVEEEKKENMETIPLLEIEDIKKEIIRIKKEELDNENVRVIRHDTFTNNIVYVGLNFDTSKVPEHLIPYLKLLSAILGKMDTENFTYSELSNEININTGGLKYNVNVYGHNDEADVYLPKFEIGGKCFLEKVPKMFELIKEIVLKTTFEDTNRLKNIISESKSRTEMSIISSGHITSATRAESYFSGASYYRDLISGIGYYEFIDHCESNFEKLATDIISNLNEILHIVFRPENLLVGTTSDKNAFELIEKEIKSFVQVLDNGHIELSHVTFNLKKKNEGFKYSSKIQYVSKAGNFIKKGYVYTGALRVLQTIVGLDYLWQNVRIKGGAYGCMASFKRNGNLNFVSYRDPNLSGTIDVYDHMHDYVSTFSVDEREMRKYIIGTASKLDQPLTPSMKNDRMIALYIGKVSDEDLQKEKDEVLNVNPEDIRNLAQLIKDTMKQDNICVLGNENKIEEEKLLFGTTRYLFS